MLVVMAGLPGTGKSALARAAAGRVGGAVLDKDPIRAALFAPADVAYSAQQDDFVMELMLETARWHWQQAPSRIVFLDGRTFSRAYQRERAVAAAERWLMVECRCRPETALARIEADRTHPAANRTAVLYHQVAAHFEPIAEPKLVIDTDLPFETCVNLWCEEYYNSFWQGGPIGPAVYQRYGSDSIDYYWGLDKPISQVDRADNWAGRFRRRQLVLHRLEQPG